MSQVVIRPAERRDMGRVGDILVESFLDKFHPLFGRKVDRVPALMARLLTRQMDEGRIIVFVADAKGDVVGTVGVVKSGGGLGIAWADVRDFLKILGPWYCLRASLGMALFFREPLQRVGLACIDNLAVDPAFRRSGLGWRLLERAELWARIEGLRELSLDVSENNPARHLYRRFGFQERGVARSRLTEMVFGIRAWIHMVKPLRVQ